MRRHQSRRGVLLGAGGRAPHAGGAGEGRDRQHRLGARLRRAKGTAAYAIAKAGVVQMTKALALELAFKGVRVNAIAPGWFVTEINDDYLDSEAGTAHHARHPDRPLRRGRRSRRRAAAARLRRRRATSPAPPSWSTAARWCRCKGMNAVTLEVRCAERACLEGMAATTWPSPFKARLSARAPIARMRRENS